MSDKLLVSRDLYDAIAYAIKNNMPGANALPRKINVGDIIILHNAEFAFKLGEVLGEYIRITGDPEHYTEDEIKPPDISGLKQVGT